jgi:AAHS family 4-hydroxybenzoate transporter-like MFS transporter
MKRPTFASTTDHTHLRVAGLCFLVLCLEGYDVTALGYATPSLIEAWQIAAPRFTTAITVGNFGMLSGSLIVGLLGDRCGRKPVLIGCVAILGVFSLLTAWSSGLGSLAILRFLTGLGIGGGIPLAITLATDFAPLQAPRRLVILTSGGLAMGGSVGGFAAAKLVVSLGWPSIFVAGGLLPLLLVPLLSILLPESRAFRERMSLSRRVSPRALFQDGLALRTLVLWVIDFCNLLCLFFILLWLPALLHGLGYSPADSIFVTTMYSTGGILGLAIIAAIADPVGVERVLAVTLFLGAGCLLVVGSVPLPYAALCIVSGGIGVGIGGGQNGINAVSSALYPAMIRATGTGWALGVARIGQIVGPLAAGTLLALGWQPRGVVLAASGPAFCVAIGMTFLLYLSGGHDTSGGVAANVASPNE